MNARRALLSLAICITTSGLTLPQASAQDMSAKPVTLVVPFAAGGSTDVTARRLAEEMARTLGTNVLVENKPGAGGFIAATHVLKSPRDGHTLLFGGAGTTSVNPHVFRNLPYKVSDLIPISTVSKQAFVLNGSATLPVKNIADLIAYAKSKPEGVTIGTVGNGTTSHILAEWIARTLGIKAVFVHYKGTSQSTPDLIGGRIDAQIDGLTTALAMHNAGKTRILASMGTERFMLPAEVPTFREAGYPELFAYAMPAVLAPAGVPDPVIAKLHASIAGAMQNAAYVEKVRAAGEIPEVSASPAAFTEWLRGEYDRWGAIIKPMNLALD
jgi:tripartite-type tricarboxylate transporter receptor subunit TctC